MQIENEILDYVKDELAYITQAACSGDRPDDPAHSIKMCKYIETKAGDLRQLVSDQIQNFK